MTRILLKGGRVIDPSCNRDESADVLIADGVISAVGRNLPEEGAEIHDVTGKWVAPGFIDMHVHLREPGQEEKETIASGASAAVNGGFTAVCCMPNTDPVLDTSGWIRYVIDRAWAAEKARVYPIGAITRGLEGKALTNMASLQSAGAVALSDDGHMVMDALIMRRAMEYARGLDLPLTLHSIDERLAHGCHMNEGALSTRLGLGGTPAHAEIIAIGRDIALAQLTGAAIHIAHVSTFGAVRLIREARKKGIRVTGEASPHHIALTEERLAPLYGTPESRAGYDTHFKMAPPLRTEDDRHALCEALADGTLDAIATDHAPHTEMEKDLPFDEAPFGVTGLETAVPVSYSILVESKLITPLRWVELLSTSPARIFKLPGGTLATGSPADVTIVDPSVERAVDPARMRSKARNSCFLGETFRGWPVMTIVGGKMHKLA